ncbi:hypothetical protein GCM10009713_31050 [Brevibacterium celere]
MVFDAHVRGARQSPAALPEDIGLTSAIMRRRRLRDDPLVDDPHLRWRPLTDREPALN